MPHARSHDGARIWYEAIGSGPPLVLLAGQANDHRWWDSVRDDFAAAHRTVVLDHLGTGDSDSPAEAEYSTRRFAADVIAVLDALGLARAHVYGTSMGGKVAQRVALDHPDRVGALVLGCTSAGGAAAVRASAEVSRSLVGAGPEARRALAELMYTPEWTRAHPGPHRTLGSPMRLPARRGHLRASNAHDAAAELGRIGAPTLVLHGTDDLLTPPDNARLLARDIPGAELVLLDGARHAYFEEQRELAAKVVLDFLSRHPMPASGTGVERDGR
ncbi:alpha/beta fold hydrolase [Saccharopolyspora sp. CA-218241]|uniref:alpha/beta fold hydrolase n=1 Tax=Saccharopolyspora sp. CA-218241 TaxID=3240027 RepID=UPI003D95CE27